MIRVVVAEDSPTARALLVEVLCAEPGIEVVGQASDGEAAVELTGALRPDLVTMDIHMPRLDGLAATRRIMAETPTPIVVVTASLDQHEVGGSLDALRAGALAVVEKPCGPTHPGFAAACRHLVDTVRAMADVRVVRHRVGPATGPRTPRRSDGPALPTAVGIAASTGGPAALHRVVSGLPADFQPAVLVVQHMAPGFMPGFAAWLGAATPLPVRLAEQGQPLAPGTIYLAPDGHHLGLEGGAIALSQAPPLDGLRPAATHLFRSLAAASGPRAVAVVLTGMGRDGVEGLAEVWGRGGRVLVQDEATSVVFGMPGAALAEGLAHEVLPLGEIAPRLVELVGKPRMGR